MITSDWMLEVEDVEEVACRMEDTNCSQPPVEDGVRECAVTYSHGVTAVYPLADARPIPITFASSSTH